MPKAAIDSVPLVSSDSTRELRTSIGAVVTQRGSEPVL